MLLMLLRSTLKKRLDAWLEDVYI